MRSLQSCSKGESLANHFNILLTIWKWPIALSTTSASTLSSTQPKLLSTFEIPCHQIGGYGSFPSLKKETQSVYSLYFNVLLVIDYYVAFFLRFKIETRLYVSHNSGKKWYIQLSPWVSISLPDGKAGNVPPSWVIEFSNPVFGNRWTADYIYLTVQGRDCHLKLVFSQHNC